MKFSKFYLFLILAVTIQFYPTEGIFCQQNSQINLNNPIQKPSINGNMSDFHEVDFDKEKKAIQDLIAKETSSYYEQNFEAWKSTYLDSPAFRKFGYWEGYPEKVVSNIGFESLKEEKRKQFEKDETIWKGSTEERINENFRISKDMAWFTFEQLSFEKDTRKQVGRSLETRILEKHNGEWKIAFLSFHYFPEEQTKTQKD